MPGILRSFALAAGLSVTMAIEVAAQKGNPLDDCGLHGYIAGRAACLGAVYLDGLQRLASLPDPGAVKLDTSAMPALVTSLSEMSYRYLEKVRIYHEACRDLRMAAGEESGELALVTGTCAAYSLAASLDSTSNAQLVAGLKGELTGEPLGNRVEELTAHRQQVEAASRLMFLSGIALTDVLLEEHPGGTKMRLAMSAAERLALVEKAQTVSKTTPPGSSPSVFNQIAEMLVSTFFSQDWPTR